MLSAALPFAKAMGTSDLATPRFPVCQAVALARGLAALFALIIKINEARYKYFCMIRSGVIAIVYFKFDIVRCEGCPVVIPRVVAPPLP